MGALGTHDQLQGQSVAGRALQNEIRVGQFHALLMTYEYIIKDRPILCKQKWLHMIIGEFAPFDFLVRRWQMLMFS